jgi:DNA polymerase III delta prime subunit
MNTSALQGNARVYLLDECQTFSRSKGAQEALLKILEDGPNHAYFFLATTEPKRILKTILSRCTKIPFGAIPNADLDALIRKVAAAEKIEVTDQLVDAIVEVAAGSGRTALVELEKVAGIKDPKEKLAAVSRVSVEKFGFDLAKELIPFKGTPSWGSVRAILKAIPKEEEHESIRAVILALAYTALTEDRGGREDQAYKVIKCLKEPMYDRVSARALLGAACYQIVNSK